jgi:hypothetical protein
MATPTQRRKALELAAGSLRTEGLKFSEENKDLRDAWVAGTLSGDEMMQQTKERAIEKAARVQGSESNLDKVADGRGPA